MVGWWRTRRGPEWSEKNEGEDGEEEGCGGVDGEEKEAREKRWEMAKMALDGCHAVTMEKEGSMREKDGE